MLPFTQLAGVSVVNHELPKLAKRSKRYPLRVPFRYRIKGERRWHYGMSMNMSDSGILFEGEGPLQVGTHFDGQLALPEKMGVRASGCITFHAAVVRSPQAGTWAGQLSVVALRRSQAGVRDRLILPAA